MLHYAKCVSRELDEVVTLEELVTFGQMRVRVVLHDARFAVVMGRVRVKVSQVFGDVLPLAKIADSSPHLWVFVDKMIVERLCVFLVDAIRVLTVVAEVERRIGVFPSLFCRRVFFLLFIFWVAGS